MIASPDPADDADRHQAEQQRDDRIEEYYHHSTRDLARRVVDLEERIAAVHELHQPRNLPFISGRKDICQTCSGHDWPCPTIRAIGDTR